MNLSHGQFSKSTSLNTSLQVYSGDDDDDDDYEDEVEKENVYHNYVAIKEPERSLDKSTKVMGVYQVDSYGGLPADAPTNLKSLKLRKLKLLRHKGRCLQKVYPLGPFYTGMYSPAMKKNTIHEEGFHNTPEWYRDYYNTNFADFEAEFDRVRPSDQFGTRRAMLDGFDRYTKSKTVIMKEAFGLSIAAVVLESLHLLLYIALYTGTNYVNFTSHRQSIGIGIFRYSYGDTIGVLEDDSFESDVEIDSVRRFIQELPIPLITVSFVFSTTAGFVDVVLLMVTLIMRKSKFGVRLAILICSIVQFVSCVTAYITLEEFITINPFCNYQLGADYALYWFMVCLIASLCVVNLIIILILPF